MLYIHKSRPGIDVLQVGHSALFASHSDKHSGWNECLHGVTNILIF